MKPNTSNRFSAELRRDIRIWQASLRHVEFSCPTIWMVNGPPDSLPATSPVGRGLAVVRDDARDVSSDDSSAEHEPQVA